MTLEEAPVGTVVQVGHYAIGSSATKLADGTWRDNVTGAAMDLDPRDVVKVLYSPKDPSKAGLTTTPEYTDTIEHETRMQWRGCSCGHPGAGCYCSSVEVRTGRFRVIRKFEKQVGEWQEAN